MIKVVFLIFLFPFAMIIFTTVGEEIWPERERQKGAVIDFQKTTLDLGEIKYSSEGSCWFIFENTGKAPLILSSVMTTCDCTASSWPRVPVLPGKTDSIRVIYNTHNPGFFSKSLEVYSNAENSPTILTIKGRIKNPH